MSKIAEQKALEAYPEWFNYYKFEGNIDTNEKKRIGYQEGYDQAMQDFMEKACKWLTIPKSVYIFSQEDKELFIEQFKNYMQDESEN